MRPQLHIHHRRPCGHIHGDIPCGHPAPSCPHRHECGRPVASSTATAPLPLRLVRGGGPPLPPLSPPAASCAPTSPGDDFGGRPVASSTETPSCYSPVPPHGSCAPTPLTAIRRGCNPFHSPRGLVCGNNLHAAVRAGASMEAACYSRRRPPLVQPPRRFPP